MKDKWEDIFIESTALDGLGDVGEVRLGEARSAIRYSTAVSLKRIADALSSRAIADALETHLPVPDTGKVTAAPTWFDRDDVAALNRYSLGDPIEVRWKEKTGEAAFLVPRMPLGDAIEWSTYRIDALSAYKLKASIAQWRPL